MATVNFSGKWKHSKDEGFDNFLSAMGLGLIKRKAVMALSPRQEITQNGDEFVISNVTTLKTTTIKFTVGQEFKFTDPMKGEENTMKASWEENKLVVRNLSKEDGVTVTRELVDDTHMTITQQKGDVTCKRHFVKIQ